MKPLNLPKSVYVGRLCRLRLEGGIEEALSRIESARGRPELTAVPGSKWSHFWFDAKTAITTGHAPDNDGVFRYPFLCRIADDRFIIASTEAKVVDFFFEVTGTAGLVESPRVLVDRAARELVFPPQDVEGRTSARRYTIGAVYGAVEGYARALRNVSFFGEDIAEASLFRTALEQISVTRLTIRDPGIDRELISINTTGGLDFHFGQPKFLNNIDALTGYFRLHNYIVWRVGRSWQPL